MARTRTESLRRASSLVIPKLREEFWSSVSVPGSPDNLNQSLEYAGRVADYLPEVRRTTGASTRLERRESCGGHFREEMQTPEGEALRDDENFSYVAAWEFKGVGTRPELHKEPLVFDEVAPDAAELLSETQSENLASGGTEREGTAGRLRRRARLP